MKLEKIVCYYESIDIVPLLNGTKVVLFLQIRMKNGIILL